MIGVGKTHGCTCNHHFCAFDSPLSLTVIFKEDCMIPSRDYILPLIGTILVWVWIIMMVLLRGGFIAAA
jgi:hypothetical protein